jgi:CheY-like chemotaxis protein
VTEAVQRERKRVVVINGDPEFLNLRRDLLQDERYNVTTTNFVPESFAVVASLKPAAVVLDVSVARRAGWDRREHLHTEPASAGVSDLVVSTDRRPLEQAAE